MGDGKTFRRRGLRAIVARGAAPTTAAALLLLTGCARFSPDAGMGVVETAAAGELGKDVIKITNERAEAHVAMRVKALLSKPLTVSSAVQVALLNNRGLQAAYNDLGISEAQMVEASLPPAPRLGVGRLVDDRDRPLRIAARPRLGRRQGPAAHLVEPALFGPPGGCRLFRF